MISYIFPFVKQNSKNFLFELFSIFDYSKKTRKITLNSFSVLYKLCRGYAALRVRLRPTNNKKDRQNCSKFIFRTTKTGGGRGFAVSRKRESYGNNLPKGKLTNDGIWKFSENLCRGYAALRVRLRPTNTKTARIIALNSFSVPSKPGAVEALPFPASGNPTAKICPKGKLTNDGIWKFSENPYRGYAALRVRLRPHQ